MLSLFYVKGKLKRPPYIINLILSCNSSFIRGNVCWSVGLSGGRLVYLVVSWSIRWLVGPSCGWLVGRSATSFKIKSSVVGTKL